MEMTWFVPLAVTLLLGLSAYFTWRQLAPDGNPDYDALMPLMVVTGSLVIWGLFGLYNLNNWFWGFAV
jgi:hypothetical protein